MSAGRPYQPPGLISISGCKGVREVLEDMARNGEVVPDTSEPEPATDWRPSRMRHSGAPLRAIDCALGNPTQTNALGAVRRFMAGDPKGETTLVLGGPQGTGKTVAAVWALGEIAGGRFIKAVDLARVDAYNREENEALMMPPLLVIDDLGTEYADRKGFLLSLIDALIDGRHANYRRTIMTTNMPASVFKERYGERIADRIRESGQFFGVSGESMRGKR